MARGGSKRILRDAAGAKEGRRMVGDFKARHRDRIDGGQGGWGGREVGVG